MNERSHSPPRNSTHRPKLLAKQTVDQGIHILAEVNTDGDGPAIDTWLYFAAEEGLSRMFPTAILFDSAYRMPDAVRIRIDPEIDRQLKGRQRPGPGLPLLFLAPVPTIRRETSATSPLAVFPLQCKQIGPPTLRRGALVLRCNVLAGRSDGDRAGPASESRDRNRGATPLQSCRKVSSTTTVPDQYRQRRCSPLGAPPRRPQHRSGSAPSPWAQALRRASGAAPPCCGLGKKRPGGLSPFMRCGHAAAWPAEKGRRLKGFEGFSGGFPRARVVVPLGDIRRCAYRDVGEPDYVVAVFGGGAVAPVCGCR